ncbi:MAG: hypothetical protein NXI01_07270 [Gammaproteobacteria bacterium]|nr:hypothetical protein [Gammaproteobacteria bacterium]
MEIIFHGRHDRTEATDSLLDIIKLLQERYHIGGFREMHLSVTLVDEQGMDVELVDGDTNESLRTFEVYREGREVVKRCGPPDLKLVVDREDE